MNFKGNYDELFLNMLFVRYSHEEIHLAIGYVNLQGIREVSLEMQIGNCEHVGSISHLRVSNQHGTAEF